MSCRTQLSGKSVFPTGGGRDLLFGFGWLDYRTSGVCSQWVESVRGAVRLGFRGLRRGGVSGFLSRRLGLGFRLDRGFGFHRFAVAFGLEIELIFGRLRVGDVWVNTHYVRLAESPFGGVKGSGIGRELGMEGLDEYLESKRVCIDSSPTFHIR